MKKQVTELYVMVCFIGENFTYVRRLTRAEWEKTFRKNIEKVNSLPQKEVHRTETYRNVELGDDGSYYTENIESFEDKEVISYGFGCGTSEILLKFYKAKEGYTFK